MLAKEVKRIIRSVFEPACRDHGFRRTKRGGIGWYHPVDDHYFVITFRTPRQWNRHWGGFLECTMRSSRPDQSLDSGIPTPNGTFDRLFG